MVIDFKNGIQGENPCGVKIVDGLLTASARTIEGVTFCNFPRITAIGCDFTNCAFENCHQISFTCGQIEGCRFHRLETLYLENSNLQDCELRHLWTDHHCVICLEDCSISGCTFKDMRLESNSYLCDAVGDVWVGKCKFSCIRTDRKDKKLFHCEETVGRIVKRKKEFDILDKESCTGLEWISGLDGAIEIGSFRTRLEKTGVIK